MNPWYRFKPLLGQFRWLARSESLSPMCTWTSDVGALKPAQAEHPGGETPRTLVGWSDKRVNPERSSTAVLDYNRLSRREVASSVQLNIAQGRKFVDQSSMRDRLKRMYPSSCFFNNRGGCR